MAAAATLTVTATVGLTASFGLPGTGHATDGSAPGARPIAAGDGRASQPSHPSCSEALGGAAPLSGPPSSTPRIFVVGDRLTAQSRVALGSTSNSDTAVIADCTSSVAAAVDTGVLDQIAAMQPEVIVLAFGPGDLATGTTPDLTRLDEVTQGPERALTATDDIACRVVVNVDTSSRGTAEPDASMWRAFSEAFNDRIGGTNPAAGIDHRRHRSVELVDWAGEVAADPGLVNGDDLTAAGAQRRAQLITDAARRGCPPAVGTATPPPPGVLPPEEASASPHAARAGSAPRQVMSVAGPDPSG